MMSATSAIRLTIDLFHGEYWRGSRTHRLVSDILNCWLLSGGINIYVQTKRSDLYLR